MCVSGCWSFSSRYGHWMRDNARDNEKSSWKSQAWRKIRFRRILFAFFKLKIYFVSYLNFKKSFEGIFREALLLLGKLESYCSFCLLMYHLSFQATLGSLIEFSKICKLKLQTSPGRGRGHDEIKTKMKKLPMKVN